MDSTLAKRVQPVGALVYILTDWGGAIRPKSSRYPSTALFPDTHVLCIYQLCLQERKRNNSTVILKHRRTPCEHESGFRCRRFWDPAPRFRFPPGTIDLRPSIAPSTLCPVLELELELYMSEPHGNPWKATWTIP